MDYKVFSGFQCFGLLGLWVFFFFLCSRSLSVLFVSLTLSLFNLPRHLWLKIPSSASHILEGLVLVMWPIGFEEPIDQICRAQRFGLVLGFGLNPKIDHWILSSWNFRKRDLSIGFELQNWRRWKFSFVIVVTCCCVYIKFLGFFFFFPCGFDDFSGFIGLICWRFWWRIEILYIFLHVY